MGATSRVAIQSYVALSKINHSLFTAEQPLNQLKIFAEMDLTNGRYPSAA
jgi:hypothetical protein